MPRVVLSSPSYGDVDPGAERSQKVAIMHAAQNGVQWLGDCSSDKLPYADARNTTARETLKLGLNDDDGIMWIDSDIVVEPHGITKLLSIKQDVVSGIYVERKFPFWPVCFQFDDVNFAWIFQWQKAPFAVPRGGCGFGFVFTSIRVLKAVQALEGFTEWFIYREFGEDLYFCKQVERLGIDIWFHPGINLIHLGERQRHKVGDSDFSDEAAKKAGRKAWKV